MSVVNVGAKKYRRFLNIFVLLTKVKGQEHSTKIKLKIIIALSVKREHMAKLKVI